MSMTIPQKKYFCKRIDEILSSKISDLNKEINSVFNEREVADCMIMEGPDTLKIVSEDKLKRMILRRILEGTEGWNAKEYLGTFQVRDLIVDYDKCKEQFERETYAENQIVMDKQKKLREEAAKIKDQAMFGNEQEAYIMLEKFQNA